MKYNNILEYPKAEVVAVDREHVVVLCPYCGEFHWHGSNDEITKQDYGTRLLHCIDVDRGSYELVTTEKTIRKDKGKIRKRDLRPRKAAQQKLLSDQEARRQAEEEANLDARMWAALRLMHDHGWRLYRWKIALYAEAPSSQVTRWLHRHGVFYNDGWYVANSDADPELQEIFGVDASTTPA
jgi:hypothetical protein